MIAEIALEGAVGVLALIVLVLVVVALLKWLLTR